MLTRTHSLQQFEQDTTSSKTQAQLARLQAQQRRIDAELEQAEADYKLASEAVRAIENELAHARDQFSSLKAADEDIQASEQQDIKQISIVAASRVNAEKELALNQVKLQKAKIAAEEKARREEEEHQKRQDVAAQKTMQIVKGHLRAKQQKDREESERERRASEEDHQRKVERAVRLKREIETVATKDMRITLAKQQAQAELENQKAAERETILAQYANPEAVFRQRELVAAETEMKAKQARNRRQQELDIVQKIQMEEKKQQRLLVASQIKPSKPTKRVYNTREDAQSPHAVNIDTNNTSKSNAFIESESDDENDDEDEDDDGLVKGKPLSAFESLLSALPSAVSKHLDDSDDDDTGAGANHGALVKPDIEGLWAAPARKQSHTFRITEWITDDGNDEIPTIKTKPLSKLEQQKMADALTLQKNSIAQKQVCMQIAVGP